jgi:nucleoside-diphosphate-sugar epimerase
MAAGTDQAIKTPGVLLLGASSQIGVFAIPRLLDAGFQVTAVSRKGRPEEYPVFDRVEWLNEADAMQDSSNCQYVLSTGPMELAQKVLEDSSKQFQTSVIFSSSSVETKQQSENRAERSQIQAMLSLESKLRHTASNKGSKLVILRPTLVYGCGMDTNISRLASLIQRFGFMPVNGKADGLRQPVHADDLAVAAVTAILSDSTLPKTLTLTGGSTLSYADMVSSIFVALGKPVRLVHLPQWLFVLLVRLLGTVKQGLAINSEMVRRQKVDLVFENREAKESLNFKPRAFSPVKEDFELPDFGSQSPEN